MRSVFSELFFIRLVGFVGLLQRPQSPRGVEHLTSEAQAASSHLYVPVCGPATDAQLYFITRGQGFVHTWHRQNAGAPLAGGVSLSEEK